MASLKTIAIVPVYNEKTHIGSLLDRFSKSGCSLVVIDDGSTDATSDILRARGINVIRHEKRSGVGKCLQDGIRYAQDHHYDLLVIAAGNGKDDPLEIPKLLHAIDQGAEYVQGSRFMEGGERKNLPWPRMLAIKSYTWLWSLCLFRHLTDVTNGFRAYRMSFLNRPGIQWSQAWLETYELEYYLHFKALKLKVPYQEVPVTKNYPTRVNYSKIRPGKDWFNIVRPLFLLLTGIKH